MVVRARCLYADFRQDRQRVQGDVSISAHILACLVENRDQQALESDRMNVDSVGMLWLRAPLIALDELDKGAFQPFETGDRSHRIIDAR